MLLPLSDIALRNERGIDPLMAAAAAGSPECVAMLLAAGARPTLDSLNATALMRAAASGSDECVDLLMPFSDLFARHGRDLDGLDAEAFAAHRGKQRMATRLALAKRAALAQAEAIEIGKHAQGSKPNGGGSRRI